MAQADKPSFDQYPSFLELSSSNNAETQSVLRCGYATNGSGVKLDPAYQRNFGDEPKSPYSRIQRIDNMLIATSIDPTSNDSFLPVELVQPNGKTSAKNCQNDSTTDTIHDCHTIPPFTFVDQIKSGDQQITSQCRSLLKQGVAQINPALADVQKTEQFKDTLRQKVNALAVP